MSTRVITVTVGLIILLGILFLWVGKTASQSGTATPPDTAAYTQTTETNAGMTHTMPDGTVMRILPDGTMVAN